MRIENLDVEYKELDRVKKTLPDSISKEICAFANTEGGEIFIGIRDDGSVAGPVYLSMSQEYGR